jgi:KTSC domain
MERVTVQSSHVTSIGFEPTAQGNGTLEVEFKSGSIYRYHNVPASEYEAVMDSASVGRYLTSNIFGKYDHERV